MKLTPEQLKQNAAAMIAFADGKPVECISRNGGIRWIIAGHLEVNEFDFLEFFYRPKPEPKTRPWSRPEDVPGPVCWLMRKSGWPCMIVEVEDGGLSIGGGSAGACRLRWAKLGDAKYSTDRKTWHPCTVTE